MNDKYLIIQLFLFMVIKQISSSRHWRCPQDNIFQHNLCDDPAHPQTTFSLTNEVCNISRGFKRNLRRNTMRMIDLLENEITNFGMEYIKWEYNIQQLQRENLTNILGIETVNEFESDNSITTIYMKMARFLRLFHKLWCLHSARAEQQCILPFSNTTFLMLKNRVLGKWWSVQNKCGEQFDHHHCETTVPEFSNNDLGCVDIRNIVYILLRDARSLLIESFSVVDQIPVVDQI
ncbi:uncharacterized protein LOC123548009 [Mercenaria mercenaria]|uniref:uncharacterized protein LOC123548009 n=1 Tax=Mercenaria mercenaria TaxID=6596 RepID=UPI00234F2AF7|nr:uncharacterized protein LOC123548009 [Mercenaria mercenaria]